MENFITQPAFEQFTITKAAPIKRRTRVQHKSLYNKVKHTIESLKDDEQFEVTKQDANLPTVKVYAWSLGKQLKKPVQIIERKHKLIIKPLIRKDQK